MYYIELTYDFGRGSRQQRMKGLSDALVYIKWNPGNGRN
jgi:hypothetical protein